MMSNHNHRQEGCGFAAELVSYLYDEIEPGEKTAFENHLRVCDSCADELAAFNGVHFAIGEWRAAELAPLEAARPAISFAPRPEETVPAPAPAASWLDSLRGFFSFGPGLMTAGAAAAVLFLVAGLVFVAFNAGREDRAAVTDEKQPARSPTAAPTAAKTETVEAGGVAARPPASTGNEPFDSSGADVSPKPVKIGNDRRATPKAEINKPKNKAAKNARANDSRRHAPTLSPYDDDDDSLRLTDLFAEIGTD